LNDVNNLISGAQVRVSSQYVAVATQARALGPALTLAARFRSEFGLNAILRILQGMRHSIATITPALPQ
jgi:hypothetical protein